MVQGFNRLKALTVTRTKKPGMYPDGGGLYLQVTKTGTKSWLFRFMLHGRARVMGLGPLHIISLSNRCFLFKCIIFHHICYRRRFRSLLAICMAICSGYWPIFRLNGRCAANLVMGGHTSKLARHTSRVERSGCF